MIAYESEVTKQSVAFYDKLKDFYSNVKAEGFILGTFDETFKDNSSRIDFITNLIDLDIEGKLSSRMHMLLSENYEFFINFAIICLWTKFLESQSVKTKRSQVS